MDNQTTRSAVIQLRRLLRRLNRAHSSNEEACTACGLQQLAMQLVDEIELESEQISHPDLLPGAASIMLSAESVLAVIYALGIKSADEQGRVVQALTDYIGDVVMDQLAQEELSETTGHDPQAFSSTQGRRGGPLY